MPSSIFPAVSTADVDAIIAGLAANPLSSNVIQIDGAATNANVATLNLKQLNIINSAGTALVAQSTGSNGNGISAYAHGSGQGLGAVGGTTGIGLLAYGGSAGGSGALFRAQAGVGNGITAEALGSDGDGLNLVGTVGAGLYAQGNGTNGPGIAAISLATSAPGIYAVGHASDGISAFGQGVGSGIQGTGGANGQGISGTGGANDGIGIAAFGVGSGSGLYAAGGATGAGLTAIGGATSGAGAVFLGQGATDDGFDAIGGSAAAGAVFVGNGGLPDIQGTLGQSWSKADIVTNTTTTIKSGAGFIHAININKGAATSTITVYDNTAGSGTKIGGVIVDTLAGGTSVILDSAFATGLTVVTAGGAAADITVTYK